MTSYAVIDIQTNKVINVVDWDGVSPYDHHKGHGRESGLILVKHSAAGVEHIYNPETGKIKNPNNGHES